jgi:hypothetical protein|tara:strand:- start:221 stop:493 length:273 start_codon:yes stop_codon:yes gene_type:complete
MPSRRRGGCMNGYTSPQKLFNEFDNIGIHAASLQEDGGLTDDEKKELGREIVGDQKRWDKMLLPKKQSKKHTKAQKKAIQMKIRKLRKRR